MPDNPRYVIPTKEKHLRLLLPGLHVGKWSGSRWHILDSGTGKPLCMPYYPGLIDEEDALECVSPGQLCQHCSRIQGPVYGDA